MNYEQMSKAELIRALKALESGDNNYRLAADLEQMNERLRQQLASSRQMEDLVVYLACLLQTVPQAIISTDLKLKIVCWNRAAELLYSWSEEEVLGKTIHDVMQTNYGKLSSEDIYAKVFNEGFWKGDVIQQRKDGAFLKVFSSLSLLKDKQGIAIGTVSVNRYLMEHSRLPN